MKSLPLPLRIAAGLVATAVEQARDLPRMAAEFPVTAVSQALQASMRMQQRVTELAIKGDQALCALRPVEETPSWATFDEDLDEGREQPSEETGSSQRRTAEHIPVARPPAPVETVETAASRTSASRTPAEPADTAGPDVLPGYDTMSIPQLRARLRSLSVDDLQVLLAWENAHEARAPFVTMLTNRITTVTAS